jgi:hypothetical protein
MRYPTLRRGTFAIELGILVAPTTLPEGTAIFWRFWLRRMKLRRSDAK